jgi:hypothetical protein
MTKKHVLTKEDSVKGGKTRSLKKKLSRRKTCNKRCPIYDRCPLAGMGIKYNVCFLNSDHPVLRDNILKLLDGGEEDLLSVGDSILADVLRIINTEDDSNVKTKKMAMECVEKLHNMRFGSKSRNEHDVRVSNTDIVKQWLMDDDESE